LKKAFAKQHLETSPETRPQAYPQALWMIRHASDAWERHFRFTYKSDKRSARKRRLSIASNASPRGLWRGSEGRTRPCGITDRGL